MTTPFHLSVSRIDAYEICQRKYWYQYVKRLPQKRLQVHAIIGRFAHEVLEEWMKLVIVGADASDAMKQAYKFVYEIYNRDKKDELKLVNIMNIKEWMRDSLSVFKTSAYKPLQAEQEIGFLYRGIEIKGRIDRIDYIDDKTIKIIDYKTTAKPKNLKGFQLAVYYIATKFGSLKEQYGDKDVQTAYVLLRQQAKEKTHLFTNEEIDETLDKIERVANDIKAHNRKNMNDWLPTKNVGMCSYCDYCMQCIPNSNLWNF